LWFLAQRAKRPFSIVVGRHGAMRRPVGPMLKFGGKSSFVFIHDSFGRVDVICLVYGEVHLKQVSKFMIEPKKILRMGIHD
jgi:hypothetical protein